QAKLCARLQALQDLRARGVLRRPSEGRINLGASASNACGARGRSSAAARLVARGRLGVQTERDEGRDQALFVDLDQPEILDLEPSAVGSAPRRRPPKGSLDRMLFLGLGKNPA